MNTLSFAGLATPSAWLEVLFGLSALTMASAYPGWRCGGGRRAAASWLSIAPLPMLAVGSSLAGMMYPEVLAATFSQI
jgi:hypothetical protein